MYRRDNGSRDGEGSLVHEEVVEEAWCDDGSIEIEEREGRIVIKKVSKVEEKNGKSAKSREKVLNIQSLKIITEK